MRELLARVPVPGWLDRLSRESPFRLFTRSLLGRLPVSVGTREAWGLSRRPAYLTGLWAAAGEARYEGVSDITAIEFGVASGDGLLALEEEAREVERETGVRIRVAGFDSSHGLPALTGDYRDHPDYWKAGDFPLDEASLRARLRPTTRLLLGDVRDTVPEFVQHLQDAPVGFISFDLDLYSSTMHALQIFTHRRKSMLTKVPVYFDDVFEPFVSHRFAGELLAIDEFNQHSQGVKIDAWRGIREGRPFPEARYLECMYIAYNLEAISSISLNRDVRHLPLPAGV